MSITD